MEVAGEISIGHTAMHTVIKAVLRARQTLAAGVTTSVDAAVEEAAVA